MKRFLSHAEQRGIILDAGDDRSFSELLHRAAQAGQSGGNDASFPRGHASADLRSFHHGSEVLLLSVRLADRFRTGALRRCRGVQDTGGGHSVTGQNPAVYLACGHLS